MGYEETWIRVDDEVTLEGRLFLPGEAGREPEGGAVILHPHPSYGGSMDNNVVDILVKAALGANLAALAFNFRGVGRSGGFHSGGVGEVADALAAAGELRRVVGRGKFPLSLLGYSFGTLVGARAAMSLPDLDKGVWVSPPLILGELSAWPGKADQLLILTGDRDQFTNIPRLEAYVRQMGARGHLEVFQEVDHFWWGSESELTERVKDFLLWGVPGSDF